MTRIQGLYWPDDVGERWRHSLKHVGALEWSIAACPRRRMAVQAGGNIGLWPRRLAQDFDQVITFEPDAESMRCLRMNIPANVYADSAALGSAPGTCGIRHQSLGSHDVVEGANVEVTTIDAFELEELDFLQLDIEGYEWHALIGAMDTIRRCRPLIQIELRDFTKKYGQTDDGVRALLAVLDYRQVHVLPGNDFVFRWQL